MFFVLTHFFGIGSSRPQTNDGDHDEGDSNNDEDRYDGDDRSL